VGDRIVGLHSSSTDAPVRHADLGAANAAFAQAKTYADWHFLATDPVDTASALPALAAANGSNGPSASAGTPGSDTPAADTPPPDPIADAHAQCYAKYGAPSVTCRGPNFAMGSTGPSCRSDMAAALDACLAAAGNP
jgi:hypothetical protein